MTNLLKQAFAAVSQLPEAEQDAIAQIIWEQLAKRHQLLHQTPIDFMQFAGIANSEKGMILETLESEIYEQRLLDLQRQIEL
jgi:hypothetical protein